MDPKFPVTRDKPKRVIEPEKLGNNLISLWFLDTHRNFDLMTLEAKTQVPKILACHFQIKRYLYKIIFIRLL